MTENEAINYLNPAEDEAVEDAFERIFFEHKQFFLTKPILLKTAESRIAKLKQLAEVSEVLAFGTIHAQKDSVQLDFIPSEDLTVHFTRYSEAKQAWKIQLTRTRSVERLILLIEDGLSLERMFTSAFHTFTEWTEEIPVIGAELDWMQFLKLLREQEEKGNRTLNDLWKSKAELPIELLRALKRLSLLKNYM